MRGGSHRWGRIEQAFGQGLVVSQQGATVRALGHMFFYHGLFGPGQRLQGIGRDQLGYLVTV
jgi:hypothetical protein